MTARQVLLGDICEFKYGKSLPAHAREPGPVRVFGSNGQVGNHNVALLDGPAIVIGRKGSFGEVHFSEGPLWPIDTTYYVDQSVTDCDLRWLQHLLKYLPLATLNKSAAVPGLNRDDAYRLAVRLPKLAEQRRIATILDKADALRRKCTRSVGLVDRLTDSIVLDMFVETDDSSWPVVSVEALSRDIRTGPFGSQLLHSEFVDEGIAVLGIDNAVTNKFQWNERRYITPRKYDRLRRYTVRPGDVLITIMGTCGRCVVVPPDLPLAINTKHLCCITLDQDKCLPEVLQAIFLQHPSVLKQLGIQAKGAVMPGLNMGIIKALSFPLPPMDRQKLYVGLVRILRGQSRARELAVAAANTLLSSLQHRAFSDHL